MEKNPLLSIAKSIAISEQDIASLTRSEKLSIRNQIVIAIIGTGASYEEVGKIFNIKERQVRNIVDSAYEDALNWYKDLPKRIRIGAFKMNVSDVFQELTTLKKIRNTTDDQALKFEMTEKIALLQIKYDRMLSDGPTLERIKEQGEILEELIKDYQDKIASNKVDKNEDIQI
jgi:DNA-binding CsgD family transcriptional regulator